LVTSLRVAGVCTLLLGLLGGLHWLHGLDNWFASAAFSVRGAVAPEPSIVVVALDAASEGRLGPLPWPEGTWREALAQLLSAQPAAVALDLPDLRMVVESDDAELSSLAPVLAGQPVVLAFAVQEGTFEGAGRPEALQRFTCGTADLPEPVLEHRYLLTPPDALLRHAAGLGTINVYPDLDGVTRSIPLFIGLEGQCYPSLALETLRVARGLKPGTPRIAGGRVHVDGGRDARTTRFGASDGARVLDTGEMLINYAGGYMWYPQIPFHQLLSMKPDALAKHFQGRLVLVGPTQGTMASYVHTPIAARLPGVEVQANALGNLVRGDYLRPLPGLVWLGLLAAVCAATGLLVVSRRIVIGFFLTVLMAAVVTAGLYLVFMQHVWVPWATPLLGVALTGLTLVLRQASLADQAKAQTEARMQTRLEAIARIGGLVDSSLDRQQLLDQIMRWVEAELNVEASSLLLVSDDRQELHFEVALGPKGHLAKDFVIKMGEGIVGMVAESGRPAIVNDARSDPRQMKDLAQAIEYALEKVLCVPMTLRGEVVGVLEVMNKRDHSDFTTQDASLLQVIAQQASLFLENARLYGVLQQRVEYANAELLAAMRDLRLEKARVETLVEEMVDGVVAVDGDNKIVLVNSVARRMLGLREQDIEGRSLKAVLAHPELVALFERALTPVQPSLSQEVDLLGDDAQIVRASVARIEGPGEETIGKCAVFTDITHFKQLDQMKTDLVSFVSHELKTPLTSIGLYGHMLRERLSVSNVVEAQDMAAAIDRQNTRMKHMVEDFLNISRIEQGRPLDMLWQPIEDPRAFIEEVVAIEARTTRDHELSLDLPRDLPTLWADRGKLEEVFINLVNNAIKYSPDGGLVTLKATVEGDMIRFSVTDMGVGIAREAQSRLFQRFSRVGNKQRVSGTGLGLFVCKTLIEAHGGKIWVESEENQGSTFHFTVPLYRGQDQKREAEDAGGDKA
jgi:two-component system phosphate regulon sensor histidine kinase PhoR